MEITQQADYAVRAVLDLALQPEGARVASDEISRRQGIPPAFLSKILARLAAEGIVDTQRGVKGGIRLARPPAQVTLLHVVEAIDGTITLNRCARHPGECARDRICVVHPIWLELCQEVRGRLNSISFAAIADRARGNPPAEPNIKLFQELPIARKS